MRCVSSHFSLDLDLHHVFPYHRPKESKTMAKVLQ